MFFLTAYGTQANLGQVFQLMREIYLCMGNHAFLCYKKDHAHVSQWRELGTSFTCVEQQTDSLGIMAILWK